MSFFPFLVNVAESILDNKSGKNKPRREKVENKNKITPTLERSCVIDRIKT